MKKVVMSLALSVLFVLGVSAQEKGDWYIGTGDIANKAWTDWSVSPTVGYGITDNLMVGMNIVQADSTEEMAYDLHARYFVNGFFVYLETSGLETDGMNYGIGKMFMFHKGVYVDPKIVYNSTEKTTNLMLGVGLKF
tara:strand:- start:2775 stop:3185 length:411 start_codon:yes stop_codon:yes gene_type:complete